MKHYTYQTQGTCSSMINFDLEDNILYNVVFTNGCDGNLKAIGKLVEGHSLDSVHQLLAGIQCGSKSTSCGDQLAKACESLLSTQQTKTTLA